MRRPSSTGSSCPTQSPGWGAAGYTGKAFLLVGALAHSGRWRGVLCSSMEQPQLIDALHRICAALGGLTRSWRFDRMATVCHPASAPVTASFAQVAKHYGVQLAICPPRRGNRTGVVEKTNHTAAHRWWRTLPDENTPEAAQAPLDGFCATRGDARLRTLGGRRGTVSSFLADERLGPLPAPFPAVLTAERKVSAQALVAYRGNFYSVPPELTGATVTVLHRLGAAAIDIATTAAAGRAPTVLARHRLATDGAGVMVREHGHVTALETAALAAFSTAAPHRRKQRIPPGPATRAAADALRSTTPTTAGPAVSDGEVVIDPVVIDLAAYDRAARGRNTPPMTSTEPDTPAPQTVTQASVYQQLRGHLATLKLHTAAEHLPAVLDAARTEGQPGATPSSAVGGHTRRLDVVKSLVEQPRQ